MKKKNVITSDRLSNAGDQASKNVLKAVCELLELSSQTQVNLQCKFKGSVREDEPLHTQTSVAFSWQIDGSESIEQHTFACKALHNGGLKKAPRPLKLPLVCAVLPEAIVERRLVPRMAKHAQVRCRSLARVKHHDERYDAVLLDTRGKKVEHVKLAHVSGNKWLVHPGQALTPTHIITAEIPENEKKKQKPVVIERIEPIPPCELRSKLFAVASLHAECLRAKAEMRAADTGVADAMFDKDTSKWTKIPKNVFVLWSSITADGVEEHHATEVPFSTLFKGRL